MRTQLALKNSYWGIVSQGVILLIGFISRKVFIDVLGPSYLGLNGLFSNVISLLSLAELGISSAIIYNLYKPLAENDQKEITKLMNFYKKAYRIIALIIAIIGVSLLPFIGYIVNDSDFTIQYLRIIFALFLFESVASYFFSYKRSIIFADQKNYIIVIWDTVFRIITTVANILILIITHSFIIYILSSILIRLLNNITIAIIADKKYPYIKNKDKIDKNKRKKVLDNIKNIMINKLSWTVTSATDNIIISTFVNLTTVGLLSNYNLIILSVQNFVSQVLNSTQAGIGNLMVSGSKEHVYTVLKRLTFLSFCFSTFCGVSLIVLINPFISIWLGKQYLFNNQIVIILVINFFFMILRSPLWQMMSASGLFKQEKNIALIGTIINLIVSLVLVNFIGLEGVLIGTLFSLVIQITLKIPLFFMKFLGLPYIQFLKILITYTALFFGESLMTYYLSNSIPLYNDYLNFVIRLFLCLIITSSINILLFRKSDEFQYFAQIFKTKLIRQKINKN
jgi:O-antigen/teichoic acid export membrane protein